MNKNSFSKEEYLSILILAKKKKYIICSIKDAKQLKGKGFPILILRHDVDIDIDTALLMAQLEQKENIQSTYFILPYNNFYNPFSPENRSKIIKIKKCGHEIGIHWDSRNYIKKKKTCFKRDLEFLSEIIDEKILSGSQHEPNCAPLLKASNLLKFEAYRDFRDFIYISDSSMQFRKYTPYELIEKKPDIQFLAHPFWWMIKGTTRKEKFNNFLTVLIKRNKTMVKKYHQTTEDFLSNRKKNDKHCNYTSKKIKV